MNSSNNYPVTITGALKSPSDELHLKVFRVCCLPGWVDGREADFPASREREACVPSAERSLILSLGSSAVTEGLLCGYTIVGKHLEHSFEYGHRGGMSRGYFKIHTVCLNKIA